MNQFKKAKIFLVTALLLLQLILSACSGRSTPNTGPSLKKNLMSKKPVYTVTFDINGGTLVSGELEQQVTEGSAATAPIVEKENHKLTWDRNFENITSDILITAQWEKTELTSTEIAEIVQKSTVTVNCEYYDGSTGSGSGFFIDDQGTIVTSYHVIEHATSINVETFNSGKYDVETIVAFSELNDLAILKINTQDSPALEICTDEVKVGEAAYANGSALGILTGTFTSGTVSNTSRIINGVSCIQMDTAISSGNSGGPLVNTYGEVIGVNAMSYIDGENLNIAVKIENLEDLTANKVNYTVKDYEEWVMKETDRSYSVYNAINDYFAYSTINTYTHVTGRDCFKSIKFDETQESGEIIYDGYVDMCHMYIYDYVVEEMDTYVEYLKTKGFKFEEREEKDGYTLYTYYNEWTGTIVSYSQHDGDFIVLDISSAR
ncbi:MAG: trypsin-like serine protease [Clostridiaceae bacterium]|nr:trypsin-like serine protease [Clostridiaceae bacterium]